MTEDIKNSRKRPVEGEKSHAEDMPAAGPHDKKELQDPMKTPGTGSLPEIGSQKTDAGPE
ncbi:hypothetical protein ACQKP1_21890 [Allorhizobium sp. NPDC080224]|uniref:hypothetical protein n=1 Tax=Allorhizobium sp. NPDC080224 TaxID=3390547 RepID=UPI003D08D1CE